MLTSFFNNGIIQVLLLLLIFAFVALLANFIRKLIWPQANEDTKVDPKKAVREELDRVLVPLEEPLKLKEDERNQPTKTGGKKSPSTQTKKPNANRRKRKSS
jgi:hypothetical protein